MPLKAGKGQPEETIYCNVIPANVGMMAPQSKADALSGQLEHRRDTLRLRRLEPRPAVGPQLFERAEARLIGHARRAFDPDRKTVETGTGVAGRVDRGDGRTL